MTRRPQELQGRRFPSRLRTWGLLYLSTNPAISCRTHVLHNILTSSLIFWYTSPAFLPAALVTTSMSVFAWTTIHYPTVDAYLQALLPFKKPAWIKGITIHHSAIPTRAQWYGTPTMEATKQYYINKGWPAGPHLFLAALTPDSSNDGYGRRDAGQRSRSWRIGWRRYGECSGADSLAVRASRAPSGKRARPGERSGLSELDALIIEVGLLKLTLEQHIMGESQESQTRAHLPQGERADRRLCRGAL
jgi:hypothetical protein